MENPTYFYLQIDDFWLARRDDQRDPEATPAGFRKTPPVLYSNGLASRDWTKHSLLANNALIIYNYAGGWFNASTSSIRCAQSNKKTCHASTPSLLVGGWAPFPETEPRARLSSRFAAWELIQKLNSSGAAAQKYGKIVVHPQTYEPNGTITIVITIFTFIIIVICTVIIHIHVFIILIPHSSFIVIIVIIIIIIRFSGCNTATNSKKTNKHTSHFFQHDARRRSKALNHPRAIPWRWQSRSGRIGRVVGHHHVWDGYPLVLSWICYGKMVVWPSRNGVLMGFGGYLPSSQLR